MSKPITYADVDRTLVGLGFNVEEVKGSHRVFNHRKKGSVIVLPFRPPSARVDRTRLEAVRAVLVATGVVNASAFTESFFSTAGGNGHLSPKRSRALASKA